MSSSTISFGCFLFLTLFVVILSQKTEKRWGMDSGYMPSGGWYPVGVRQGFNDPFFLPTSGGQGDDLGMVVLLAILIPLLISTLGWPLIFLGFLLFQGLFNTQTLTTTVPTGRRKRALPNVNNILLDTILEYVNKFERSLEKFDTAKDLDKN